MVHKYSLSGLSERIYTFSNKEVIMVSGSRKYHPVISANRREVHQLHLNPTKVIAKNPTKLNNTIRKTKSTLNGVIFPVNPGTLLMYILNTPPKKTEDTSLMQAMKLLSPLVTSASILQFGTAPDLSTQHFTPNFPSTLASLSTKANWETMYNKEEIEDEYKKGQAMDCAVNVQLLQFIVSMSMHLITHVYCTSSPVASMFTTVSSGSIGLLSAACLAIPRFPHKAAFKQRLPSSFRPLRQTFNLPY